MATAFNQIPSNLRTPGVYVEFDNSLAGAVSILHKILVVGQMLPTATVQEGVPIQVTNGDQSELYFGRGSMLTEMLRALFAANRVTEVYAIGLNENAVGTAASGSILVGGAAASSGTLFVHVAGKQLAVTINNGDASTAIALAIVAAITAQTDLPITAAINGGNPSLVDITCRWRGETGNDIDIRTNYSQGGNAVSGVPLTITAMSGGIGNPDIASAIANFGDEWWNWIVTPFTDATNLTALETELLDRWGPLRQIGGRAFCAVRGTHAATAAFGNSRNSFLLSCIGTGIAPQPTYIWAAVNAGVAAASLMDDPARPLQTLALPGILPPSIEQRFTRTERNVLLFDGITTYTVGSDGVARIERQVTMYQTNSNGQPDASYLDINTPETLEMIRYEQRNRIATKFARHKLAEDGTQYGGGQLVATPSLVRGELLALYRELENKGWVEGYDDYAATIRVEIGDGIGGGDRNRVNVSDQPDLVNQFRIHAQKTQFII